MITKDSEATLENCLKSVAELASEIILVDDGSKDKTVEIAKRYGARIFQKELKSFGAQKEFALSQANEDWIFLIDSDETATPALIEEIRKSLSGNHSFNAYKVPRRNFYFQKWLKHGAKYPDHQVRLYKKNRVHFSSNIVHEKVMVEGEVGVLKNWIDHFSYTDMDTWFKKLKMFSEFNAEELYRKGVKPTPLNFARFCVLNPLWRFDKRYFLKLGFLDGLPGLIACVHDALTEILTYMQLSQKCKMGLKDDRCQDHR